MLLGVQQSQVLRLTLKLRLRQLMAVHHKMWLQLMPDTAEQRMEDHRIITLLWPLSTYTIFFHVFIKTDCKKQRLLRNKHQIHKNRGIIFIFLCLEELRKDNMNISSRTWRFQQISNLSISF